MEGYPFETLGAKHLLYLSGTALVSAAILLVGSRHLDPRQRHRVAMGLAIFGLGQELADDLLRVYQGVWVVHDDLPLHLCSLGMLVSVWALITKRQLVFEVAYYWGLAASAQALLTPDNTRWQRGELDVAWNFFSHGAVILNVLWLALVDRIRCRRWSWLRVLVLTNLLTVPVALINLGLGANYFFICRKPGGESPFLFGEWPWYLLGFEVMATLLFLLLYQPMAWVSRRGAPRS